MFILHPKWVYFLISYHSIQRTASQERMTAKIKKEYKKNTKNSKKPLDKEAKT
jgi:hypothetical protein